MAKRKPNESNGSGPALPLVIVNPGSAGGHTREHWPSIASDLRTHFGAYNVAFTGKPGDGTAESKLAAANGCRLIIACGGDGTVNEVANGILSSGADAELAVFPSGTGGDFRRSLGIPESPREVASALKTGETKWIDVGKVTFQNDKNKTVSRYFLNVSSFGLSASIIERMKSSPALNWLPIDAVRGPASYALSTFQEVLGVNPFNVRVKLDEKKERVLRTVNFAVANARYFGGGMMIAPTAKIDDGFLDVVNVGDMKSARIILNAYSLYLGTHTKLPEVKTTLAQRIEARPQKEDDIIPIEVDGELPGKLPATYEIVSRALRVRIPKNAG